MNYKELKRIIQKHNQAYYDRSASEITDSEYDQLYDKLENIEEAQGWKDHDSPTLKVGGAAGKVSHPHKLYSLRKVYELEEVDKFMTVKLPKVDGTNLTLIYKRGKLKLSLTRGNGERGEDVTHLTQFLDGAPAMIDTLQDEVVINGECVTDLEVDNYRNYVSGALGLKDAQEFKQRNIKFIAHDWLGVKMNYTARMKSIKNMGFYTVLDDGWDYPQDGLVYRTDSWEQEQALGHTSKYPKFAVALKEKESLTATTTLLGVDWSVGRTGTVNPTGIIEPVTLDDATLRRVTLHNIGIIEEHNLGLGDLITVERAGGVIPKFLRVVEHSIHNQKVTKLTAERAIGAKTKRDGPRLIVDDKSNISSIKFLEYFIRILEIKGLGPASVKKLGLTHPVDLYDNPDWGKLGANGVKVEAEVERTKTKPYDIVLASLGIPGVGRRAAKMIVPHIPAFRNLRDIDTTYIKGIGPSTIESILSWLDDNESWVLQLPLQLEQNVQVEEVLVTKRKVCITGKLDMTRKQLTEILEEKGFQATSTVTKDCYALIAGDSGSSKHTRAQTLGVTIIDYWSSKKDVLSGNF